jgi:hypothetical protein
MDYLTIWVLKRKKGIKEIRLQKIFTIQIELNKRTLLTLLK